MSYFSRVIYPGLTGAVPSFAIPFPFLDRSHVHFYLVPTGASFDPSYEVTTGFVFASDSLVTFVPNPTGCSLEIRRRTPNATPVERFQPGTVSSEALNNVTTQLLYVSQEASDATTDLSARALQVPVGETAQAVEASGVRSDKVALWSRLGKLVTASYAALAVSIAPFLPANLKGNPGDPGPALTVGLFSDLGSKNIPVGTDRILTSGNSVNGLGSGFYDFDAAFDYAANPLLGKLTANGRVFKLSQHQHITLEQAGGKADTPLALHDYQGGGFTTSLAAPVGTTDNRPALLALMAYTGRLALSASSGTGGMQPIWHENNDNALTYFMNGTIYVPNTVSLWGTSTGSDGGPVGTIYRFPPNTGGIYCNHESTQPGAAIVDGHWTTYGSNGTIISGIAFVGAGGTDRTKHGLFHNTWVELHNCAFFNFSGDNTHNEGSVSAGPGNPGYGQTSGSLYHRVFRFGAGNNNGYVDGGDVSASIFIDVHDRISRLCGNRDTGYFNNSYPGYQNNGHGSGFAGAAWRLGRNYSLISHVPGIGSTTVPGTDPTVWEDEGAAAAATTYFPAYDPARTYELSLPFFATGIGTTCDGYMEVYYHPCHFGGQAACINAQMFCTRSSNTFGANLEGGGMASSPSHAVIKHFSPDSPIVGPKMTTIAGGPGVVAFQFSREKPGEVGLPTVAEWVSDGLVLIPGSIGSGYGAVAFYSTVTTTVTFGTGAALPGVVEIYQLAVPNISGTLGDGRRLWTGATTPSSGLHAQGELSVKNNSALGGIAFYYCTTTGTPGTWQPMGIVGAVQALTVAALAGDTVAANMSAKIDAIISALKTAKLMA